jgi:hypothetical protein
MARRRGVMRNLDGQSMYLFSSRDVLQLHLRARDA